MGNTLHTGPHSACVRYPRRGFRRQISWIKSETFCSRRVETRWFSLCFLILQTCQGIRVTHDGLCTVLDCLLTIVTFLRVCVCVCVFTLVLLSFSFVS